MGINDSFRLIARPQDALLIAALVVFLGSLFL